VSTVAVLAAYLSPLHAQESDPAALPPALLASTRVDAERSEPAPGTIEITRGDTIVFAGILRDASGERVEGARWGIYPVPEVFDLQSIKDSVPDSYLLWGVAPGVTELRAVLLVPGESEASSVRPLFRIPVRVNDWPAARVEIDDPAFAAFVGSTFSLEGRVITTRETEHQTAVLRWSSSDPDIVSITAAGVASFKRPGRAEIRAESEGLSATYTLEVVESPVAELLVAPSADEVRTGDVVHLSVTVNDRLDQPVENAHIAYSVSAIDGPDGGAVVYNDGAFVAEQAGTYRVMATAGGQAASALITASPRNAERAVNFIAQGPVAHVTTSDLWIFEGHDGRDYAYTGTHADGGGERMFVWDVSDPAAPLLSDSIVVDARVVNDVKINQDASIAVITREGASNRRNGIVILDIQDPAHPVILSELTENLTAGIHNVWFNGDVLYAINDGTAAVHIIDLADPANPQHLGRWEWRPGEQNKYVHDVWAADGLAYLSYWDDGLIILDVGAGIKGGTPRAPQFVSQYKYAIGNTHTAYRYGDYVFVGDEIFGCEECTNGPRGYIHVVDVRDIENPHEVARFEVPEAGAHNIWVEDGTLYIAYYQGGLRVVDVTGELRGDLYAQGRQVAHFHTAGAEGKAIHPNAPLAWGPQPHKGYVFISDMNSGLWVVQLEPPAADVVP
jgi:hypothetical protein